MTRRYLVVGRVQGVGFRWFVLRGARALGLSGFVRNMADGRVEVIAVGSEADQASLADLLRVGPRKDLVSNVEIIEVPGEVTLPTDFMIRG
jgi:acylphosphatase